MKQNGIMPNVVHFTQFISNLLHDGDLVAAQHVFDVEMPAAGIEPDDITEQTMARAEQLAIMGRAHTLKREKKQQSAELSIGDTVIITRNGQYQNTKGKLVSETSTGFQVDIGASGKTIAVASSSLQKVDSE